MNIARTLGYVELPEAAIVSPKERDGAAARRGPHPLHRQPGRADVRPHADRDGDHPNVTVESGDTVIISAKPVPGNELRVHDAINRLARLGAEVLHQEVAPVHVSGHACAEELRTLLSLVRPRAVMPIHGEYRCSPRTGGWRGTPGSPRSDRDRGERPVRRATPGRRPARRAGRPGVTFVDGLGVGDVEDVRSATGGVSPRTGVIVVTTVALADGGGEIAPPELIARGVGEDLDPDRRPARRGRARASRQLARDGDHGRSSSSRSTSTTGSARSSTTARDAGP